MAIPPVSHRSETRASHPRSSRQRYRGFLRDYAERRLDDPQESGANSSEPGSPGRGKRREYLREYLRWLWPLRYAVGSLLLLALVGAGLQMVEPLFMRFMIDRVLLNTQLDSALRLSRLHLAGAAFLGLIVVSNLVGVLKDYRQRLLNTRVMLSLRRALFDRLLHLPMPRLWDMKTGGILSRLTGDVETTTGLLQMAVVSPAVSTVRLIIAVAILLTLNWRLALTALASSRHRADELHAGAARQAHLPVGPQGRGTIDGRVGETFSGIRVVRAFGREMRELLDYMRGRHTVLRKELFANRRELSCGPPGPAPGRRQRRHRLVRRIPEHRRPRFDRRHHGVSVVHVPAVEPGVADRQFILRAPAFARGHGARLRSAGHGGR